MEGHMTDINESNDIKAGCMLQWTNLTKMVEIKDPSVGLIKTAFGASKNKSDGINPKEQHREEMMNRRQQPNKIRHKIILNQVSGQAKPGEILALMGPSGSGKTSLLDLLASRSDYQEGSLILNSNMISNHPKAIKRLKRKIAYIQQNDIFFQHLTVSDQLTYTAFLRLGDRLTTAQKQKKVQEIIALLRLEKCEHTPIRLISGGERKRVNIGTELLTNPSIIILDEPTSGLDSTSAVSLMKVLKSLATDFKKTVITSIHQPSSHVYFQFHKVLFLVDGCVVYYGNPNDSLVYCQKLGLACPDGYNAADHWMDLLVGEVHGDASDSEQKDVRTSSQMDDNSKQTLDEACQFPIKMVTTAEHSTVFVPNDDMKAILVEEGQMENENDHSDIYGSVLQSKQESKRSMSKRGGSMSGSIKTFMARLSSLAIPDMPMDILDEAKKKRDEYLHLHTAKAKLINAWNVDRFALEMGNCESVSLHSISKYGDSLYQENEDILEETENEQKFNTRWITQFHVLLHRSLKNSKAAVLTQINFIKSVALGILSGLLWFQMPYDETHVVDRGSFLFFATTYWIFEGIFDAIFAFPMERDIIFKERASGSYHLSAYFLSKTLSEMPTKLLLPSIFWSIAYWMADINPRVSVFFGTLFSTLLAVLTGESYGLLCGALVMDFEKSMNYMIVISLSTMAAGGYYVDNIPSFISWVKYLSPFKFGYESNQIMVFDRKVLCDGSGILQMYCTPGVESASKEEVLDVLNSEGSIGRNIGILVVLMIIPRYLAFLALKSKKAVGRS